VDGTAELFTTKDLLVKKQDISFILSLVDARYKRQGLYLIFLLIASSVFDLFSLASFIPLILMVLDPKESIASSWVARVSHVTGIYDPTFTGISLILCVLLLIFLKNRFSHWVTFKKASFGYNIASDVATRTLSNYLTIPYNKFAEADYSREVNRIINIPIAFANNFVMPAGTILVELCIAVMLLITVSVYNVYLLLFLAAIVTPVGAVYYIKRKQLRAVSKELKSAYPQILKHTLQSVEGLTEIRSFGKEEFFKRRFQQAYGDLGRLFSKDHTASVSAARTTELVAAACIGAVIIYLLLSKQDYEQTLLLITIYAGAGFRAIPSINRIFSASLQMKTYEYVVEEFKQMLAADRKAPHQPTTTLSFKNSIKFNNISFAHAADQYILKNVQLKIQKGEKIALMGKSGSGKTTLLLLLMRYITEQSGDITLDGIKIETQHSASFRKLMGYVPQNPYILDASVAENIAFGIDAAEIDTAKISKLVSDLGLQSWIDGLPQGIHTRIGERGTKISGGQRQRLAIARALYYNAEVLLLDEITNQLDRQTEEAVMQLLDCEVFKDKTVIFITHKSDLLHYFHSAYTIEGGKLDSILLQPVH
jgi:ATP-binding cassette, subfamily B, bacterial PglK